MRISIFLLGLIFLLAVLPLPASANYEWNNTITLNKDNMSWVYTERYSSERSVIFKVFVDAELGDNDGFVSSWELVKAGVETSDILTRSITRDMDVRIDNSSKNVVLDNVDSDISEKLIGPVSEQNDIVNVYYISYTFEQPLNESGSSIWFKGEPNTSVTLDLASGIKMISISGIEGRLVSKDSSGTEISGSFGYDGQITMEFAVDIPVREEVVNETNETEPEVMQTESSKGRFASLLEWLFSELSDLFE